VSELERPAAVELSRAWVRGQPGQRLMVILRAPGCAYALRSGGCTNCGFHHLTTRGVPVPATKLVAQLQRALDEQATSARGLDELDLFCSGSFFNDGEVPSLARRSLLELCAALPGLRSVVVESRPEYATADALIAARAALGHDRRVLLEVAIGLESANDEIRLRRIHKGFSLSAFEQAATRVAALGEGAGLVVYLLLKPIGTGEEEAVEDVLASGRYLADLAQRLRLGVRVALEPAFVPDGTPLADELRAGRYAPPSLWSALRATAGLRALGLQVHVGLSDEGLPASQVPSGCWECSPLLRAALARFNESQDPACLQLSTCACQQGALTRKST